MELIIQKATELGVSTIQPFTSQHCSPTYDPRTQEDRWRKIAMESCKQCKRSIPPMINPIISFEALLANTLDCDKKIILWENEPGNRLAPFAATAMPRSLTLLIGPEGGFLAAEVRAAQANGFQSITLGPQILRAETAAIAAMAICQYLLAGGGCDTAQGE